MINGCWLLPLHGSHGYEGLDFQFSGMLERLHAERLLCGVFISADEADVRGREGSRLIESSAV